MTLTGQEVAWMEPAAPDALVEAIERAWQDVFASFALPAKYLNADPQLLRARLLEL